MQFDSLAAALDMGGHGPYVWAVAVLTVVVVTGLLLVPVLGSRRLLVQYRGAVRRRDQQLQQHTQKEDGDASGS